MVAGLMALPDSWAATILSTRTSAPFVPTAEVEELYAKAKEPKELWIVPEAGHREVDLCRPEEYLAKVLDFFDNWVGQGGQRIHDG